MHTMALLCTSNLMLHRFTLYMKEMARFSSLRWAEKDRSCRSFSFRTERQCRYWQALKHKDSTFWFHAPLGGACSCNATPWFFNTAQDYSESSIFTSLPCLWPKCNWIRPFVQKKCNFLLLTKWNCISAFLRQWWLTVAFAKGSITIITEQTVRINLRHALVALRNVVICHACCEKAARKNSWNYSFCV